MSITGWVLFNLFILGVLALDLFVFHKKAHSVSFKEAALWSLIWIVLALLFNIGIYFSLGKEPAINFLTGYLIEKSLSVDNLFVFLLIFKYFQTPPSSQHKVLFWGVLGAILTRALFIFLGITLVQKFQPIIYIFGAFLIFSGIKLALEKEKKIDPEKNLFLKVLRYFFPFAPEYEADRFFIKRGGKFFFTPLCLVLVAIETADIIFAVDSIPAILAITYDPFIVYTSNIFAILGLRSLFFLLAKTLDLFYYLHYGLAVILVFVGLKMLLNHFFHISPIITLSIVLLILLFSIGASLLFRQKK